MNPCDSLADAACFANELLWQLILEHEQGRVELDRNLRLDIDCCQLLLDETLDALMENKRFDQSQAASMRKILGDHGDAN